MAAALALCCWVRSAVCFICSTPNRRASDLPQMATPCVALFLAFRGILTFHSFASSRVTQRSPSPTTPPRPLNPPSPPSPVNQQKENPPKVARQISPLLQCQGCVRVCAVVVGCAMVVGNKIKGKRGEIYLKWRLNDKSVQVKLLGDRLEQAQSVLPSPSKGSSWGIS